MAQGYRYKGDGSTFECDGGHILVVKRGFNVGTRCCLERRCMYRVEYGIGFFNEFRCGQSFSYDGQGKRSS